MGEGRGKRVGREEITNVREVEDTGQVLCVDHRITKDMTGGELGSVAVSQVLRRGVIWGE